MKSNRQLTKNGFDPIFVQDAWAEWTGADGANFDPALDVLGLVTGVVGEGTLEEWEDVRKEAASTTPERFLLRVSGARQLSATKKKIFESLCLPGRTDKAHREETVRLAAKLHVQHYNESKAEGRFVNQCAQLTTSGALEEGTKLWNSLLQLASDNRGTGGYFDLPKLLRHLRAGFDLRDYPDFEVDWTRLDGLTSNNLAGVRAVLGAAVRLDRKDEVGAILKDLDKHAATVIVGESGCGKSAVAANIATLGNRFGHVVWLSPAQLSKPSQSEIALNCGLRHSIPHLLAASSRKSSLLIIDAFEKVEGEALQRIEELLRVIRDEDFTGWKLLITCQLQTWEQVSRTLRGQGIADVCKSELNNPTLKTVRDAVQEFPGLGALFLRPELQPILRNLMVLDWVLRTNVGQALSEDPRARIGETDLINSIWEHWISRNRRLERDRLLRSLGLHEGEKLSGAVQVDSIDQGQLQLLEELSHEELVRIEGPSVRFAHDLIGDWARFRTLIFAGTDAIAKIKSAIQIPRWNRAVRLYAQSLVEAGHELSGWKEATSKLSGDDPESKLARDLFLEGILFAANSVVLLEAVWPELIADNAHLLRRLLDRLLLVASFPDVRLRSLVSPEDADQSESWFRIPMPIYWYPALLVLNAHAADIVKHALLKGAEVCALYLRNMPDGMPGRIEAGQLAQVLAREAQDLIAEGVLFVDSDKTIYEAALLGAAEDAGSVGQIALELCARRPEPNHAVERRSLARRADAERRAKWRKEHPEEYERHKASMKFLPGVSSAPRSERTSPAPDGPKRRISEGFRDAVMNSNCLTGLISHRPDIAKEVLLAVCIEDPEREERGGIFSSFGLARWQNGYPSMYWKGPFLTFLQLSPHAGLEAIVRLANFVTEEWMKAGGIDQLDETERRKYGLEFQVGTKTICWFGNGNLYNWHRDGQLHENTVGCALMALEQWLYHEVSSGRSIDEHVRYLFEHSISLALAGVLISLGLRYPILFTGCLQPLLGNLHIYHCQASAALNETSGFWRIAFAGQPRQVVELASAWQQMPHRRLLLREIVPSLMLQDAGTRAYMTDRIVEWESLTPNDDEEKQSFQLFIARFRLQNYQLTPQPGGMVEVKPVLPETMEQKRQLSQAESEFRLLSMGMAIRARRILEGQETLSEEELPTFFAQVKQLQQPQYPDLKPSDEKYRRHSIAGGLAALVVNHRKWLSQNPTEEEWCFGVLKNFQPLTIDDLDSPESGDMGHNAETFLGEVGVFLLQESDDEWVLRLAVGGIAGFYYASTLFAMWRAFVCRERLAQTFDELINAMLFWSAFRRIAIREAGYHSQRTALSKYRQILYARLRNERFRGIQVNVQRTVALGTRLVERIARRDPSEIARRQWEKQRKALDKKKRDREVSREMPSIDLQIIQSGFCFLSASLKSGGELDRRRAETYIQELFLLEMASLPLLEGEKEGDEIGGTAWPFDIWVMQRAAEMIASQNSLERARPFFEPILRRGPAARYWTQDFLEAWITVGLPMSKDLSAFARVWKEMVEYTKSLPAWKVGTPGFWCPAESLAVDLMGIHDTAANVLGRPEYRELVKEMAPTFYQWGEDRLKFASNATWFAHFLTTESGRVLLPQGLKQLATVVSSFGDRDWERGSLASMLTAVLATAWKHLKSEIEYDLSLRGVFLNLLTELCSRSVPEAIHLRERVSQLIVLG